MSIYFLFEGNVTHCFDLDMSKFYWTKNVNKLLLLDENVNNFLLDLNINIFLLD